MSHVSNAMLFFSCEENAGYRMGEVNSRLFELDELRGQVFGDGSQGNWYGGNKFLEGDMWGAAFNHVEFDWVMEAIGSAEWARPEDVFLVWQDQGDSAWSVNYL